jgi:Uma2 family endonuclease
LIEKTGKSPRHVLALVVLLEWLHSVFGPLNVLPGAPVDVAPEDNPSSEPEPDLTVVRQDISCFANSRPQPRDIALLVEIAGSSPNFDLTIKAGLYARAGIAEYWVLDIAGRRLIVHRNPADGRYTDIAAYSASESVAPLAAPSAAFNVRAVLE